MKKLISILFVILFSIHSVGQADFSIPWYMFMRKDGSTAFTGDLDLGTNSIVGVSELSLSDDTVMTSTTQFLGANEDTGDNLGNHIATTTLNMSGFKITNLSTPTSDFDGATKKYVDDKETGDNLGNHIATTTLDMDGNDISNVPFISFLGDISNAYITADEDNRLQIKQDNLTMDFMNQEGVVLNQRIKANSFRTGGGADPYFGISEISAGNLEIFNVAPPTFDDAATNKQYVDDGFVSTTTAEGYLTKVPTRTLRIPIDENTERTHTTTSGSWQTSTEKLGTYVIDIPTQNIVSAKVKPVIGAFVSTDTATGQYRARVRIGDRRDDFTSGTFPNQSLIYSADYETSSMTAVYQDLEIDVYEEIIEGKDGIGVVVQYRINAGEGTINAYLSNQVLVIKYLGY